MYIPFFLHQILFQLNFGTYYNQSCGQRLKWPGFFVALVIQQFCEHFRLKVEETLFPTLRYFRDTILVDLNVPLSFPFLILSSFYQTYLNVMILTVLNHVL